MQLLVSIQDFFLFLSLYWLIFNVLDRKLPNAAALRKPPKWNWKGIWKWNRCRGSSATQERSPSTSPCHSWAWAMPRRENGCTRDMQISRAKEQLSAFLVPVGKATAPNVWSREFHSSLRWEKDMVCARNGKSCNRLHQTVSPTPRCEEIHFLRVLANVYWSAFQNVSWFLLLPEAHCFPSSGLFVFVGVFHVGREG